MPSQYTYDSRSRRAVRPVARYAAIWLVVSAVACAPITPRPSADGFVVRGKFSAVGAGESISARFVWAQDGDRYDIQLWGPLGQGRVHLVGDPRRVARLAAGGEELESGAPEDLADRYLGFRLPIPVLAAWLAGAPHPDYRHRGSSDAFEQLGWQVAVIDRVETAGGRLPRRLSVNGAGGSLQLLASDWQFAASLSPESPQARQ